MTVNSTEATISYNGAGSPGPLAIPFYFLDDSHIVAVKTVDDVATTLVLGVDYTLTGEGDEEGGSLLLDADLETGEVVDISLNVPYDQQSTYNRNDPFPAATTERALDKLTMICKQLRDIFAVLRGEFDAVNITEINASIDALESDVGTLQGQVTTLIADLDTLEANQDLPHLDGYAYALDVEVPEGSVLVYSKSDNPADPGALGASYMPVPHSYAPADGDIASISASFYRTPARHINSGAGTLAIVISIDDWAIGVEHQFVQQSTGKITIQIGDADPVTYVQVYDEARGTVGLGTYNGIDEGFTPVVRSNGVGARFSIVRTTESYFHAMGHLEVIP